MGGNTGRGRFKYSKFHKTISRILKFVERESRHETLFRIASLGLPRLPSTHLLSLAYFALFASIVRLLRVIFWMQKDMNELLFKYCGISYLILPIWGFSYLIFQYGARYALFFNSKCCALDFLFSAWVGVFEKVSQKPTLHSRVSGPLSGHLARCVDCKDRVA